MNVIKSIILFIFMFSIESFVPSHLIGMERYIQVIIFLTTIGIPIIWYYRTDIAGISSKTKKKEALILMAVSLIFHGLTVCVIHYFATKPEWPFDSRGASLLLMNNFFIWAKPLDVFMQQLLIVLLVLRLKKYELSQGTITSIFVLGFGATHILQLFRTGVLVGFGFTIIATIFSFIFPRMILNVKNGYIYNYMIHLAVYDIFALIAWFMF